jgi:hypothetical protein
MRHHTQDNINILHGNTAFCKRSTMYYYSGPTVKLGPGVAQWLRHCANSRTVSGSIPSGVTLGIFSVATDVTMCRGVDSASKNEYQGFPLGVKAAGAWGWRPTTLVVPNVKKIRDLNLPGTPLGLLWARPLPLPTVKLRHRFAGVPATSDLRDPTNDPSVKAFTKMFPQPT